MITKLGKQKLEATLVQLQAKLSRTCEERGIAAEGGDLKVYSQIDQVKADLKTCVIQSAPTQTKTVVFGSKVKIKFESDGRELEVTLVGKNDTNLQPNWISVASPLGQALLNQSKGSKVSVNDQLVSILNISIGEI
jgi:transcription elongation GreA/GreB family factor